MDRSKKIEQELEIEKGKYWAALSYFPLFWPIVLLLNQKWNNNFVGCHLHKSGLVFGLCLFSIYIPILFFVACVLMFKGINNSLKGIEK